MGATHGEFQTLVQVDEPDSMTVPYAIGEPETDFGKPLHEGEP